VRAHRSRRFWVAALGLGPAVTGVPLAAATTIPFGSVQVVVATSGLDSNTSKVVTAVCPAGKKALVGSGGRIGSGFGRVGLDVVPATLQRGAIAGTSTDPNASWTRSVCAK